MSYKKIAPTFLLATIIILSLSFYWPKDEKTLEVQSTNVEKQANQRLSSYPTFIGDEGVLDASEAKNQATHSIAKQEDTESHDVLKEETSVTEENKMKDESAVAPASSEKKTPENHASIIQTPPEKNADKATESKKVPVDIPKSNLAIHEYLLPLPNSEERVEQPTHIVVHFTSNALNKPSNPYLIDDTYQNFKNNGVSSHYVIGRAGELYSFVPEDRVAYHAGKGHLSGFPKYKDRLNHYSIGIELLAIGTKEEMSSMVPVATLSQIDTSLMGYTDAQYQAINTLIQDITSRNPAIQKNRMYIVGHDEYAPGRKMDPGSLFDWSRLGL